MYMCVCMYVCIYVGTFINKTNNSKQTSQALMRRTASNGSRSEQIQIQTQIWYLLSERK